MKPLRCAVIGVGYLGKFHAQKYAKLPGCELVAVVDSRLEVAQAVAKPLGCRAVADYRELLGQVDAVSVVVPTQAHHAVTLDFLRAGAHVLVEKPIAVTLEQADEMIEQAERSGLVLAVGHLERFNPVALALEPLLDQPRFIESTRLAPFKPRATDVSVLLDLMIHDVDLILSLVDSEIVSVDSSGARVLTNDIDIANARIRFANGCVANVTASRVSNKSERKMRVFQHRACHSLDFGTRHLISYRATDADPLAAPEDAIERQMQMFGEADALLSEITDFVASVREGRAPKVSGRAGRRALAAVQRISAATELIS
ncbi:predicted dehydrogenase and related protein [Serpentinimonas raichei]|uniref:Predicted dehydrogenase and related protein n=1 Tax=Serpentinimonas raichei TaxID=1458425 RepID=A0A060NHI3_9BURK|nr:MULTISPECIES: Gfo/Idh/MocA family oxidoreductase [Serpentinimonas]BAO80587.1 predicted dehydrogenase and related protein [Serpentinimonas raichei]